MTCLTMLSIQLVHIAACLASSWYAVHALLFEDGAVHQVYIFHPQEARSCHGL